MNFTVTKLVASAAGAAFTIVTACSSYAAQFHAIYHNVPGVNGSEIPGLGGTTFTPGSSLLTFRFPYVSGNGNWALRADANVASSMDDVIISNGMLIAQEGTAGPFGAGELYGPFDNQLPINDAGTFVMANNTNGAVSADEYILKGVGGAVSVVAKEGQSSPIIAGTSWAEPLNIPAITADGRIGFLGTLSGAGITADVNDRVAVIGTQLLAQRGVTVPGGQGGGAMQTWRVLNGLATDATGNNYMLVGELNGALASDGVAVLNGNVVIQEGTTLSGLVSAVTVIAANNFMDGLGNWMVAGRNVDTQDWLVRNGSVIAAEGQSVSGGANVWLDPNGSGPFSWFTGNDVGDYLISGYDNSGPGSTASALILLNGSEVVAKAGDAVDLNGNGLFDDDAFFSQFIAAGISNNKTIYATGILKHGDGSEFAAGLFTTATVPEPSSLVLFCIAIFIHLVRRK